MQLDFLTPRVERLNADGRLTRIHAGGFLGRLRPPVVLLARELCAFSLFPTAALPRSKRRQAARLHARAAAPYLTAGSFLVRAGPDFGVWWWDQERVAAMLTASHGASLPAIRPETLAQPRGSDWRIVRLDSGYEAQLWSERTLYASAWRRDRFDAASWSAFARTQRTPKPPPVDPPAAHPLPLALDSEAFAPTVPTLTREQAIGLGLATVAGLAVCLALFNWGQALRLSQDSETVETEVTEIQAATPRLNQTQNLDANQRKLVAYREIESRTNPLSAAGAALGILAIHDLSPTILEAETDRLSVTLPYSAISKINVLVEEFQSSGYFFDVQPRSDGGAGQILVIEAKVREAAPPLDAGPVMILEPASNAAARPDNG